MSINKKGLCEINPVRHEVAIKSCGTLIPLSMLLDKPTILNKERVGQRSEAEMRDEKRE